MTHPNWAALFDEAYPEPPVPPQYLTGEVIEDYLFAPPSEEELKDLVARDVVPTFWEITRRPLPPSYKAFLGWSNGGTFVTGDREFQMLKVQELREYLLLYDVPQHMPGAVPFGLDGDGAFYLFDLRDPPGDRGEYPVLYAPSKDLGYGSAVVLGRSLEDVLRDKRSPGEVSVVANLAVEG
jgi:hypothetical protein